MSTPMNCCHDICEEIHDEGLAELFDELMDAVIFFSDNDPEITAKAKSHIDEIISLIKEFV